MIPRPALRTPHNLGDVCLGLALTVSGAYQVVPGAYYSNTQKSYHMLSPQDTSDAVPGALQL